MYFEDDEVILEREGHGVRRQIGQADFQPPPIPRVNLWPGRRDDSLTGIFAAKTNASRMAEIEFDFFPGGDDGKVAWW